MMEFNEKLQELRKSRGMTQEELAEALFVSRTAVSKWESGRGYPSIDSLKAIAQYFSVTIDSLIGSDEIILMAENEKKEFVGKYLSLICNVMDIMMMILLFIPVFNNGSDAASAALLGLYGIKPWIRITFAAVIGLTVLNGICGVILTRFERPVWHRHRMATGMILSVISVLLFIISRQPYAGIICFAALVTKGFLLLQAK